MILRLLEAKGELDIDQDWPVSLQPVINRFFCFGHLRHMLAAAKLATKTSSLRFSSGVARSSKFPSSVWSSRQLGRSPLYLPRAEVIVDKILIRITHDIMISFRRIIKLYRVSPFTRAIFALETIVDHLLLIIEFTGILFTLFFLGIFDSWWQRWQGISGRKDWVDKGIEIYRSSSSAADFPDHGSKWEDR